MTRAGIAAEHDLPPASGEEERDVWWGGYAPRTMLPSLLVCTLLMAGIALLAWHHETFGLRGQTARYTAYALGGAVWLCQMVRWVYRTAGYTYRLTTRRLFLCHGFLYPLPSPIELAEVTRVLPEQSPWERGVGVGRVRILCEKSGAAPVVLQGVSQPARVAALIDKYSRRMTSHDR